jgi:hypothetical protein
MFDLLGWLTDLIRRVWLAAMQRPDVRCDIRFTPQARWTPDWWHDDKGKDLASGIQFEISINFLLANHGPVNTSLQNLYIELTYHRNRHAKLASGLLVQEIEIAPRRSWGPKSVSFSGSIWNIDKPPQDMKFQLIVEPLGQRPVRKSIYPLFDLI